MRDILPLTERVAAEQAARAAIAKTLSEEHAAAEAKVKAAERAAASASNALVEAEARALTDARLQHAKAFRLQFAPLVVELLKHETLDCARDCTVKYRALQAGVVKYTGVELPLMPLAAVGQHLIIKYPETKSRIARLDTIASPFGNCAATETARAHAALMAKDDPRTVRDAIIALERKLTAIGKAAVPGGHTDLVWNAVREGLDYFAIDALWRAACAAEARVAAEASPRVPEGVAFRIANGWAKLRNVTMGDSPL